MMRIEDIAAFTQPSEGVQRLSSGTTAPAERLSLADAELLAGVCEGRHAAFEQLVTRFQPMIYSLLYRVLNDPEDARDVTQETFLKVYQYAKSFRGDSELKTWIYRIAVNQAANHQRWWRRRWRKETISLQSVEVEDGVPLTERLATKTQDPEQHALISERRRLLAAALADLKFDFRVAVAMRDIKGLTYEEIADALQISVGTVKSRIARGREELRRKLKGQF